MKANSHRLLGQHLADCFLQEYPRRYVRAFLLGCIEPDKNPSTYLKGSLRHQWLRGHNWGNAQRYMQRTANRLERREVWRLLDFYNLGKLIHYTTDAFTYAHNSFFPENLKSHVQYERQLQTYFGQYMKQSTTAANPPRGSVMETIRSYHRDYAALPMGIHTDSRFSLHVCSLVVSLILPTVI